jgi:hypothetical protein
MTVLENMRVTTAAMLPFEMTDIEQRRVTALSYLEQIGTHRAEALIEYIRARTTRDDVLDALAELLLLVRPRETLAESERPT